MVDEEKAVEKKSGLERRVLILERAVVSLLTALASNLKGAGVVREIKLLIEEIDAGPSDEEKKSDAVPV